MELKNVAQAMIQHIIITQFSYRGAYKGAMGSYDPLKKENLDRRFNLFELGCLPGMLNQENQNFTWILIVDKDLPPEYKQRLTKLLAKHHESHLINFQDIETFQTFKWLKPFIKPGCEFLLTTKLDDDDMLYTRFTQELHEHVQALKMADNLPYFKFFGCDKVMSWDFFWSKNAPYGYYKPWIRSADLPVSAGLSLFVKYPEMELTVFCLAHNRVKNLITFAGDPENTDQRFYKKLKILQDKIITTASTANLDWDGKLSPDKNFHFLQHHPIQAVVINHITNSQYGRMFESLQLRKAIDPATSFPGIAINFQVVADNIKQYKRSIPVLTRAIKRAIQFREHKSHNKSLPTKILIKLNRIHRTIVGVMNMK